MLQKRSMSPKVTMKMIRLTLQWKGGRIETAPSPCSATRLRRPCPFALKVAKRRPGSPQV